MKRNSVMGIGATASLALILAACSGSDGGDSGGGDNEDVTLGFFTDKAAWESSFDAMNEVSGEHGMTLDFTGYSDQTAFDSFVKQSFRTDSVPDLFTWHTGGELADLVDEGLVAETTDLWAEAEENGLVPDGLIDNYTYDGKQYCVPLNVAYWPVYYNIELFEQYDLDVPETWDELMQVADVLVENGEVPFHQMNMIFEFVWFQAMLAGNSPEVYEGLQTGDASYTDPEVVEVMEQWKQMIDDGYFIDPGVTTDPQALLANGDVAMAYFGTFFTGQLTDVGAEAGEDYGVFTMPNMNPEVENRQMILETSPLCVGAGSENEEAALEYSAWWMTNEAQNTWSADRGDVSFNPNVDVADPTLSALVDEVNSEESGFTIQQRYLEATPVPIYSVASEIFGEFVTNAPDPMPGLERLQAEAEDYWAGQE
ncbi:extracellular solute-binding protein [Actinobacteria bacterium YIM 96077]|uniref:Carbohydrate ABC transporter substrate-binding protein n=1 Tax=Phytoactinopolyspora halophila TaxID=1981511 RepID=A0A329QGA8_9ACTN|nr:extracellular solute-binding protein [Phytoactinopolyspora halophila]AYY13720.1 extracellular solute-binding protein [Actinobacteria bacterium YIM 96077]RAW09348.1 carbohydrate ABC transporter substrate-binding protein [Phytoactinopolyspora halophila]